MSTRRFQRDKMDDVKSPEEIMGKAMGKKDLEKVGKVHRVTVERADNGWSTSTENEPKKGGKGDMPSYEPPKKMVHESKKSLMDHLDECLED